MGLMECVRSVWGLADVAVPRPAVGGHEGLELPLGGQGGT